jgi:hypothetical protein
VRLEVFKTAPPFVNNERLAIVQLPVQFPLGTDLVQIRIRTAGTSLWKRSRFIETQCFESSKPRYIIALQQVAMYSDGSGAPLERASYERALALTHQPAEQRFSGVGWSSSRRRTESAAIRRIAGYCLCS